MYNSLYMHDGVVINAFVRGISRRDKLIMFLSPVMDFFILTNAKLIFNNFNTIKA